MSSRSVKYYFAYNSPYAFLANTRIGAEMASVGGELDYRPVYSPRTAGGGPDMNSPKMTYIFEDAGRFAEAYGLTINPGPFADTKKACLGLFFAQAHGKGREYHDEVYRARWLEGKDLGQDDVLVGIAESCGLDGAGFRAALADERHQKDLDRSNANAQEDRVFGVPTFVYGGERFWGNDRIEWLVRKMKKAA
jgi:2-hydroxychromene-2-carboxylate isomerase